MTKDANMANEQMSDGSEQSLPAEQSELTNQEAIDWEKKYKEDQTRWQEDQENWKKRESDKDAHISNQFERLKAYDKYEPTLKQIEESINQRKAQERAQQLQNGDINPLKEELKAELKAEQEAWAADKFRGLEEMQTKAEEDSLKFELSKVFTGEVKEKYGKYAWEILQTAAQQGGEPAFKAWVSNTDMLLRHAKGAYLDAQEQEQASKASARVTNSQNHRKAMSPTARMGVSPDRNDSQSDLMTMPLAELEKLHIAAGGRRINIK